MLRKERNTAQTYDSGAPAGADGRGEGFDLKEKIKVVRRRSRFIIITTVLITGLVALIALSLPPRYVAVASVLIEQRRTNVMDTESVVEEERMDSRALAAETNLLRSRTYAEKVVEELDLLSSP
jgi:polysaccharide biosynthesis transport protein